MMANWSHHVRACVRGRSFGRLQPPHLPALLACQLGLGLASGGSSRIRQSCALRRRRAPVGACIPGLVRSVSARPFGSRRSPWCRAISHSAPLSQLLSSFRICRSIALLRFMLAAIFRCRSAFSALYFSIRALSCSRKVASLASIAADTRERKSDVPPPPPLVHSPPSGFPAGTLG